MTTGRKNRKKTGKKNPCTNHGNSHGEKVPVKKDPGKKNGRDMKKRRMAKEILAGGATRTMARTMWKGKNVGNQG